MKETFICLGVIIVAVLLPIIGDDFIYWLVSKEEKSTKENLSSTDKGDTKVHLQKRKE